LLILQLTECQLYDSNQPIKVKPLANSYWPVSTLMVDMSQCPQWRRRG